MSAPWLHPASISRTDVEAKLGEAGMANGTFLVRKREQEGQFVLSVVYKGKPTHHLCAKDPASGNILVNKKDMAKSPDIVQVVKKLAGSTLPAGWPIKLTKACNTDGSSGPPSFDGGGGGGGGGGEDWLVAKGMAKDAAGQRLMKLTAGTDGCFFVRPRGPDNPDDFVMAVVYKGKPTHHLITKAGDSFKINNKPTGCSDLGTLINKLKNKQPYWPVPLTEYATNSGGSAKLGDGGGGGGGGGGGAATPKKAAGPKGAALKTSDSTVSKAATGGPPPWLFPAMAKGAADNIMKKAGLDEEGRFFIRKRGAEHPNDYVICVVYKGKSTHHLTTKGDDGCYHVNKKKTPAKNVRQVAKFLKDKKPFWPVPLTKPVNNPKAKKKSKSSAPKAADPPKAAKAATPTPSPAPSPTPDKPLTAEEKMAQAEEKRKQDIADAEAAKEAEAQAKKEEEEEKIRKAKEEEEEAKKKKAEELLRDVHKIWVDGQKLDVTIARDNLEEGFGFGVASKFRIEGRAKIVSFVDPKGPAAKVLKVGDEIIALCGEPVFDIELDDLKELIREMNLTFDCRVFRPTTLKQKEPPALTLPAAEETITIEPKVINFCGKVFTIKKGKTITKKFETPERAKINGSNVVMKKGVRTKTYDGLFCESKAAQHRRVREEALIQEMFVKASKEQYRAEHAMILSDYAGINSAMNTTSV